MYRILLTGTLSKNREKRMAYAYDCEAEIMREVDWIETIRDYFIDAGDTIVLVEDLETANEMLGKMYEIEDVSDEDDN